MPFWLREKCRVVEIAVCLNSLWFMIASILVFWYVRKNCVISWKNDANISVKNFLGALFFRKVPLENFLMLPTPLQIIYIIAHIFIMIRASALLWSFWRHFDCVSPNTSHTSQHVKYRQTIELYTETSVSFSTTNSFIWIGMMKYIIFGILLVYYFLYYWYIIGILFLLLVCHFF